MIRGFFVDFSPNFGLSPYFSYISRFTDGTPSRDQGLVNRSVLFETLLAQEECLFFALKHTNTPLE